MRAFIAKLTLAAAATLLTANLYAQNTDAIAYGRATVVLTPAVLQQFTALGVTVTDLSYASMSNGTTVLPALEGAIDLDTAYNEVVYGNGYAFRSGNNNTVQVRNLTLDLFGTSAIFYGIVIKNGTLVGREAIFSIVATGAPSLPIVPVNGTINHNGLLLSFQQPFISLINSTFGTSGLTTTGQIGTLDLYSVLASLTPPSHPGYPYPGNPNPGPRW